MKRTHIIAVAVLVLLVGILLREPIMDLLPIDQSGWSTNAYGKCYLDKNGDPVSGWYSIDGQDYYFTPGHFTPHTGWVMKEDAPCYVADGVPVSGWAELEDGRYYLTDGVIHTGWAEESGQRWYLLSDGTPASGWMETDQGLFYFDASGKLCTGMVETDKGTFCFNTDGTAHAGWYKQAGKRYYFHPDGSMYTGWLEEDGNKYYLKEDGSAAVGKLVIQGEPCFFSSTGVNFILVNPWHALPGEFEPELVITEGANVAVECQEDLETMMADCRAAGFYPQILSGYRSINDQAINLNQGIQARMNAGYSYSEAYRIATQVIAVPGTSEHHLGLAMDIVDTRYPELEEHQENTPTQKWLMENSWKYGFIMRYPSGTTEITGIIYEPWHYRYVGKEMAKEIYELGVCLEVYVDMLTDDGTTCGGKLATAE